jgi:thioredoxin 1
VTAATSTTIPVTDETFAAEVLGSDVPVLVDFWATWCPPCKRLAPILDQLAAETAGRFRVTTINVDENPLTARAHNVLATPTLMVFTAGTPVRTAVGLQPKRRLTQLLTEAESEATHAS